jgi:hypothetical protein
MSRHIAYRIDGELRTLPMVPDRSSSRPTVIIPAPTDYHVFMLTLPAVPEREMYRLLLFRLRSAYPGPVETLCISYHRLDNGEVMVPAMEKSVRDDYRRLVPSARLVTAETLALVAGRHEEVVIAAGKWSLEIRRKPFSRVVKPPVAAAGSDACAHIALCGAGPAEPPASPRTGARAPVASSGAGTSVRDLRPEDLIPRALPRRLADFDSPRRRRSWWGLRFTTAAVACAILVGVLMVRDLRRMRLAEEALARRYTDLTVQAEAGSAILHRVETLEAEIDALPDPPEISPWRLLAALAEVAAGQVEVSEITIRGGRMELSATAGDPLLFADRLAADPRFDRVTLVRVQPDSRGSKRFSLSGVYSR